jgi:polyhydroxyalkanoate synthesis regulator phasin
VRGALERHAGSVLGRGAELWKTAEPMARRPANPSDLPDALREAVERTVEATLGSAGRSREAARGALDDLAESVEGIRKDAESRLARSRRSVTEAIEGRRPATYDDIRELKAELRAVARRLDAIEERLPARRGTAKRTAAKRAPAKRGPAKRAPATRETKSS